MYGNCWHSSHKNRKKKLENERFAATLHSLKPSSELVIFKKCISKAYILLGYSDTVILLCTILKGKGSIQWYKPWKRDFFFPSLLQLRGSRVEAHEGKVFSSLEPYFRFRFLKFKFL